MVAKLTIVICTRNRGDRLGPMLESVRGLSSDDEFKLILIDNASTDRTSSVLDDFTAEDEKFSWYHQPIPGLGMSRRFALEKVDTEFVSFTDDDCYLEQDFVASVLTAFASRPELDCIGGRILLHNPQHARVTIDEREERDTILPFSYVKAGALHGANLSFRTQALKASGGFDGALGAGTRFPCEDIDAVASLIWTGRSAGYDPSPTVRHDHGRTAKDLPSLERSYDRGRGAYFAKYISRPASRLAYIRGWWWSAKWASDARERLQFRREAASFLEYSASRSHWLQFIAGALTLPVLYLGVVTVWSWRKRTSRASSATDV